MEQFCGTFGVFKILNLLEESNGYGFSKVFFPEIPNLLAFRNFERTPGPQNLLFMEVSMRSKTDP